MTQDVGKSEMKLERSSSLDSGLNAQLTALHGPPGTAVTTISQPLVSGAHAKALEALATTGGGGFASAPALTTRQSAFGWKNLCSLLDGSTLSMLHQAPAGPQRGASSYMLTCGAYRKEHEKYKGEKLTAYEDRSEFFRPEIYDGKPFTRLNAAQQRECERLQKEAVGEFLDTFRIMYERLAGPNPRPMTRIHLDPEITHLGSMEWVAKWADHFKLPCPKLALEHEESDGVLLKQTISITFPGHKPVTYTAFTSAEQDKKKMTDEFKNCGNMLKMIRHLAGKLEPGDVIANCHQGFSRSMYLQICLRVLELAHQKGRDQLTLDDVKQSLSATAEEFLTARFGDPDALKTNFPGMMVHSLRHEAPLLDGLRDEPAKLRRCLQDQGIISPDAQVPDEALLPAYKKALDDAFELTAQELLKMAQDGIYPGSELEPAEAAALGRPGRPLVRSLSTP